MATTPDVLAASSPAPAVPTDPKAYAEWRQTGKTPEPSQPKEESAPSKDSAAGDEPAQKTAPASEAGKKQEIKERPRSNAETRLNELLEDLRHAGLSPAELKTFKREAQRQEKPAEPQKAAPERTEKPAGLEPPKKPKPEDFEGKTWEEYEAAKDKYYEDLADFKAQKRLEDFRAEQKQESQQREMQDRLSDAKQRYGAEAEPAIIEAAGAIFNDAQVHAVVKALVNDSPVLVDLLYVAASKPEDFAALLSEARTNPGAAIRRIVLLEKLVQEELAKGGKPEAGSAATRGEDGKFKAPEKKVTGAPPPPKEVSGRGTSPPDEIESAAKNGDFRSYRDAANRRDLARAQGR